MFSLNDKVVYPGHGVAKISNIVSRFVAGNLVVFYELKFQSKEMTIMVPKDRIDEVGIRALSSSSYINDTLDIMMKPAQKLTNFESATMNWNKRNKEYQSKLRTGSLLDISEIYRDLKFISRFKELSFGEKGLLVKTEALLAEEISAAEHIEEDKALERLRALFASITFFEDKKSKGSTHKIAL